MTSGLLRLVTPSRWLLPRAEAIARRYSPLLGEVDCLLLLGSGCAQVSRAFARQVARVVYFERDDAVCADLRTRLEQSRRLANAHRNILLVDSRVEGEVLTRSLSDRYAVIDCDSAEGADSLSAGEAISDTLRAAHYLVLPGSARLPERGLSLIEALDARGPSHEFNVANGWSEPPKFSDWQRRSRFRDRVTAQHQAYALLARQPRNRAFAGWSLPDPVVGRPGTRAA